MKTLLIIAHPNIEESRVCRAWVNKLSHSNMVTVHNLYLHYPTMDINVIAEQNLLLQHDKILFIFPFYWYSSPAILKHWFDLVLQPGFAYGPGGDKLAGKSFMVATSIGSNSRGYKAGGYNNFTLDELLRPIQQSINYIGGKYLPNFSLYESIVTSENEIDESAIQLEKYVLNNSFSPQKDHESLVIASMEAMMSRAF